MSSQIRNSVFGLSEASTMGQSRASYWNTRSDLWVKSRMGNTLIDQFGNNPTLLFPTLKTNGSSTYADTGLTAVANTIWVIKGKLITTVANKWQGAQVTGQNVRFFFGTGTSNNTINFAWGDTSISPGNNKEHDFDWHVFIMYDKRLWVLDKDTALTDASILNAIATQTPLINLSTASFSGTPANIQYGRIPTPAYVIFEFASSFIGTITAGAITWQRKHIMGGASAYTYDILSKDNLVTWNDGTNNVRLYSENGSLHFIEKGYSLYKNTEFRVLVPYLDSGQPMDSPTVSAGFTLAKNISDARLFIPDCKIRFVNDFFDRSNATIYSNDARDVNYYDATNPKDWNGFEFYRQVFYEFYNTGYQYRHFTVFNELSETNYPTEIILTKSDLTSSSDKIKTFNYCKDYDVTISISQLTKHIDHQNGSRIFGFDGTAGEIFYSVNSGGSYLTKEFADAENIGMSFIFNNGNILFATNEKAYLSTDSLQTWNEIAITDQNGDVFPVRSGVKNFLNVRYIDSQILSDGKQMITWGAYINVVGNGYVCLFYSINGESIKTAYMFGRNANYGNYGDPLNTVIARHIHSSTYSPITGKWYWNTGDSGIDPNYENHYFESEYNYLTDVWTNTKLVSGGANSQIKAAAFFYYNGNIYLSSDATSGDSPTKGVFKVIESGLNSILNQTRIFTDNGNIMSGLVVGSKMKIVFPAGITYNAGKYRVVLFREKRLECPYSFVYWPTDFEVTPAQTDPDNYVAWRLIKVSETEVLCNFMGLDTLRYNNNTVRITL